MICGISISYIILFPLALARNPSSIVIISLFSVVGCVYLSLAVTTAFFIDKLDVPSKLNNINSIDAFKVSSQGLISSSPLIIFAYMYQVFIPCLYEELETRTPK